MLNIKELTEYDEVIGISASFYENVEHPIFGLQEHSMIIDIIDGEIKYACLVENNIPIVHDIYKGVDIFKTDFHERWDIVEEILSSFLELSKEDYELIYNSLNYDSIGFKLAEKVLNSKIDALNEELVKLNNIKGIYNEFYKKKKL
jgi:hypothetical protein